MSIEKSYTEFIILHERKGMKKAIGDIEKYILSSTTRAKDILGNIAEEDISSATEKINEGITELKKILIRHQLYEI